MSVQFSGGEPTISPYFLDAVRYARKVGYNSVQAATNGIEFAKSPEFAKAGGRSRPALRVSAVRRHRQRRQLAPPRRQPVRRQAARDREPLQRRRRHRPGHHDRQRREQRAGRPRSSSSRSTTRRRSTSSRSSRCRSPAATRRSRRSAAPAQRYTLSHLAHDVKNQTGIGEPVRDWFPISFMGSFTDWADVDARRREGIRPADLRLPPELRRRHGDHDRQGNEGSRAGHRRS